MRTDPIDLEIAGSLIRVICRSPKASTILRSALEDHLVDEPATPGFVLNEPERGGGFHTLLDRSGFILARTRTPDESVAILGSHLAALLPPPAGTVRIRMRALLRSDGAVVLAAFPLFTVPPVVERRLERSDHRLIDRLAVDMASDGCLLMTPMPWSLLSTDHGSGHAQVPDGPLKVHATLVPMDSSTVPSLAGVVAFLAREISPLATRQERLSIAERLASNVVLPVDLESRSARYEALGRV